MKNLKGGFSDEVFNQPYLQRYIQHSDNLFQPGGYIGHSGRTSGSDKYLEKVFKCHSLNYTFGEPIYGMIDWKCGRAFRLHWFSNLLLAIWLTSTDGRHFCDGLEGEPLIERRKMIDHDIKRIHEVATRYFKQIHHHFHPDLDGLWASINSHRRIVL
jgi:hypothetical protein